MSYKSELLSPKMKTLIIITFIFLLFIAGYIIYSKLTTDNQLENHSEITSQTLNEK